MNACTTLLTDSALSATDDANGEKFVDDSALQILVQVALEFGRAERLALTQTRFCAPQRDASPPPRQQRTSSTAKFVRLSEHGNAWSFRDNVMLWRAYEAWQRNGIEIQEWRTARANVAECSFPFYAHEKFFASRRTLVGVRKHFFKLKRRKFGQVLREQQTASMSAVSGKHSGATISIPKSVWTRCTASALPLLPPPPPARLAPNFEPSTPRGIAKGLYSQTTTSDDETCDTAPTTAYGAAPTAARRAAVFFRNNKSSAADAVASDRDESSDDYNDGGGGQDAFSRTFLRISQQSLARRKRKRCDLVGGETPLKIAKPASSELMYREIVQRARWRALRE